MEINSSLLNDQSMKYVKASLVGTTSDEKSIEFRVDTTEYIDMKSDNDSSGFFYDMLPYMRFTTPDVEGIAWTDKIGLIYLNCPNNSIGDDKKHWDFIYDHECLHQLWDTFGVEDELKKNGIKFDHMLLNIASDCVINDYLHEYLKKSMPEGLITPKLIKERYGVEYSNKDDTQYTLYLKLLEKLEEIKKDEDLQQKLEEFEGKIKPKEVKDGEDGGDGGDGGFPIPKHSEDYIKGWTDGIKDVLDKKVDPLDENLKPKNTGNEEYDKGYNDVIGQIKNGLENGIEISKSGGSSGEGGDLPQIPWDIENQNNDGGGKGKNKKDDDAIVDPANNDKKSKDGDGESSTKDAETSSKQAKGFADMAKKNADKAQKEADEAKEAAKNGKGSEEDAEAAQKKADKVKAAADAAKEAAERAEKNAKAAKAAHDKGDSEKEAEANKEADKNAKEAKEAYEKSVNPNSQKQKQGGSWGDDEVSYDPNDIDEVEFDKIKEEIEKIKEKYKDKITGSLGDFVKKCKSSAKCDNAGLAVNTSGRGTTTWNKTLYSNISSFIKTKTIRLRREFERTFTKPKSGKLYKFGEPLERGKRRKNNSVEIGISYYVDISGSMYGCIDEVWNALYAVTAEVTKRFKSEKLIKKLNHHIFAFNTTIYPITYGDKMRANGGNVDLEELMDEMKRKNPADTMINIILTDAQWPINKTEVIKFVEDSGALFIFITNQHTPEIKKLSETLRTQIKYIEADESFSIE